MGGSGGGRDLDFWRRDLEIPLWAETRPRHEIDVATKVNLQVGRDLVSVSRPGLGLGRRNGVATPFFEVATWAVLVEQKGGCDMGFTSRLGLVIPEVAT